MRKGRLYDIIRPKKRLKTLQEDSLEPNWDEPIWKTVFT